MPRASGTVAARELRDLLNADFSVPSSRRRCKPSDTPAPLPVTLVQPVNRKKKETKRKPSPAPVVAASTPSPSLTPGSSPGLEEDAASDYGVKDRPAPIARRRGRPKAGATHIPTNTKKKAKREVEDIPHSVPAALPPLSLSVAIPPHSLHLAAASSPVSYISAMLKPDPSPITSHFDPSHTRGISMSPGSIPSSSTLVASSDSHKRKRRKVWSPQVIKRERYASIVTSSDDDEDGLPDTLGMFAKAGRGELTPELEEKPDLDKGPPFKPSKLPPGWVITISFMVSPY
jgi:hypothetical protein